MQITLTINGLDRMRGVAAMATRIPEACHEAAMKWTNHVFEESQQIVPVHSGRLRATGRVEDQSSAFISGTASSVIAMNIVYGNDTDVDYAVLIHEVEVPGVYPHPEHFWDGEHYNCGGDWHFVSAPIEQHWDSLAKSLEAGIRGVFA